MKGLTKSNIPYLTHNWPVVTGCTPCSPACNNCWARAMHERFHPGEPWKIWAHGSALEAAVRRKKPAVIGVAFTADLFHEFVPDWFIDRVFAAMALAPQHVFVVLTKRPERMREYLTRFGHSSDPWGHVLSGAAWNLTGMSDEADNQAWNAIMGQSVGDPYLVGWPMSHVMLGVTVWDQASSEAAAPHMKDLHGLGWKIWISYEPALGPLNVPPGLMRRLSWIVAGCERLPGGRAGRWAKEATRWIINVDGQTTAADVPCFVKQWEADSRVEHNEPDEADLPDLLKGMI